MVDLLTMAVMEVVMVVVVTVMVLCIDLLRSSSVAVVGVDITEEDGEEDIMEEEDGAEDTTMEVVDGEEEEDAEGDEEDSECSSKSCIRSADLLLCIFAQSEFAPANRIAHMHAVHRSRTPPLRLSIVRQQSHGQPVFSTTE